MPDERGLLKSVMCDLWNTPWATTTSLSGNIRMSPGDSAAPKAVGSGSGSGIAIQTASGTSGAEMTIEGVREFNQLRDYLYTRMRGARGEPVASEAQPPESGEDEALALLREIRDLMRRKRGAS